MRLMLALAAALLMAGCATTGSDPRDPWEGSGAALGGATAAFGGSAGASFSPGRML